MLISFVISFYTLLILYVYGRGTVLWIGKIFKKTSLASMPFTLIIGLMAVTTLASFASIFIRINWEFQAFLLLGALAISLLVLRRKGFWPERSLGDFSLAQKIGVVFFGLSLIVLLYAATLYPANPDTGIYHAQAIHWIESYPAVPGLANLHQRLGYDSSWLLSTAVFSFSYLNFQSFHLLTGVFFLIFAGYCYQGIHGLLGKKYSLSNFLKLGFFLSSFIFLFDQISSPGTDAPATLMVWFILTQTVQLFEERLEKDNIQGFFLILLGFYCVTIKLSSAPILLAALGLMLALGYFKNARKFGWTVLGSLIILLPFITRNFILTGYPVFPGFPINLFHFDWAYPLDGVIKESQVIHWFAMLPNMSLDEFSRLSLRDQTIQWFYNQLPRHRAILLFIMFALAVNVLLCVFRSWRNYLWRNKNIWFIYAAAIFGCVFWFFSAPAIRFGYGFLLGTVFLLAFPLVVFSLEKSQFLVNLTRWVILLGSIAIVGLSVKTNVKFDKVTDTLINPTPYPGWSSEPCSFANFHLLCQAAYDSCWYSPFPCAIGGNEQVEMRGTDYSEGFKPVH